MQLKDVLSMEELIALSDGANVEALVFQCERRSSNPFEKMRPLASPGRSATSFPVPCWEG